MVRRHYGDLSSTLILGNFDRRGLLIWFGFATLPSSHAPPSGLIAACNEQAIKSHFEQSARAVALTVCPGPPG
jgi:hypothetical protein